MDEGYLGEYHIVTIHKTGLFCLVSFDSTKEWNFCNRKTLINVPSRCGDMLKY